MTNIDNSEVSGVTIDGEAVKEVTVDGETVWPNSRILTVEENSGTSLSDYTVAAEFGSSDSIHTDSSSQDIRIYDQNGSVLNYWIERWNPTRIWIRVPSIPANGSIDLKMHYGNGNTSDVTNNPETTFDWYMKPTQKSQFDGPDNEALSVDTGITKDMNTKWIQTTFYEDFSSGYSSFTYHAIWNVLFADGHSGSINNYGMAGWDYGGGYDPGGVYYGTSNSGNIQADNGGTGAPANNTRLKMHTIHKGGNDWRFLYENEASDLSKSQFYVDNVTGDNEGTLSHIAYQVDSGNTSYTENYDGSFGEGLYIHSNTSDSSNRVKACVYGHWIRKWTDPEPTVSVQ